MKFIQIFQAARSFQEHDVVINIDSVRERRLLRKVYQIEYFRQIVNTFTSIFQDRIRLWDAKINYASFFLVKVYEKSNHIPKIISV